MRLLIITVLACLSQLTAQATKIIEKELPQLVAESDHVLVCKVVKVQMVDETGKEVTDRDARTGPGLKNELRLHVELEKGGVIKSNAKNVPEKLIIPLWQMWHASLGSSRDFYEGGVYVFLLKGADFRRVYAGGFQRDLSEKADIETIIRKASEKK